MRKKEKYEFEPADRLAEQIIGEFCAASFDHVRRERRRRRFLENVLSKTWSSPLTGEWLKQSVDTSDVITVDREVPEDWDRYAEWLARRFHAAFELHFVEGLDVQSALSAAAKYGIPVICHPSLSLDCHLSNIGFPEGMWPVHPTRSAIESVPAAGDITNAEVTYHANIRIAFNRALESLQSKSRHHDQHTRLRVLKRRMRRVEDDIFQQACWDALHEEILDIEKNLGVRFIEGQNRYVLDHLPEFLRPAAVEKMRRRAPRTTDTDREAEIAAATRLSPVQRVWALATLIRIWEEAMYTGLARWRAGCLLGDHNRVRKHRSLLGGIAALPGAGAWMLSDYDLDTAETLSSASSEVDRSNWRQCLLEKEPSLNVNVQDLIREFDRRAAGLHDFRSFRPR